MMLAHDGLMSVDDLYQLYGACPPWPQTGSGTAVGGWVLPQFSMVIGRPVDSIKVAHFVVLWNWLQPYGFLSLKLEDVLYVLQIKYTLNQIF